MKRSAVVSGLVLFGSIFTPAAGAAADAPGPTPPASGALGEETPGAPPVGPGKTPLARAAGLLRGPDPEGRIEGWRALSEIYAGSRDPAERKVARDLLEPFIRDEVLSPAPLPGLSATITVRRGDSLWKIARRHRTTVESLRRVNALKTDNLQVGDKLKLLHRPFAIFVRKAEFRLWVTYDGLFLLEMTVGIGEEESTPTARFVIQERMVRPVWQPKGKRPLRFGDPDYPLGTRWLGFRDTGEHEGFGIHGTNRPESIGRKESSGCIRLRNRDVELLYDLIPKGTPVTITD